MTVKELIRCIQDLPPDTHVRIPIDNPFVEYEIEQVSVPSDPPAKHWQGIVYLMSTN